MADRHTLQFRVVLAVAVVVVAVVVGVAHAAPDDHHNNNNNAAEVDDGVITSDIFVQRGHSAKLDCNASLFWQRASLKSGPIGSIEVRWLHNGVHLGRNDARWKLSKNGTLVLPKFGKRPSSEVGNSTAEGVYHCIADSHRFGAALVRIIRVRLAYLKEFLRQPSDLNVGEGQAAILPCSVNSQPRANVFWEREDNPLPHDRKFVPLPSGSLLITNVHSTDVGSYRCKVINSILKKTKRSRPAHLTIASTTISSEEIMDKTQTNNGTNITTTSGEDVVLYCLPGRHTSIRWVNPDGVFMGNTSILFLTNITFKQSGEYICSMMTADGTLETKVYHINVLQAPEFNSTPSSGVHPLAGTIRLNCTATGSPPPRITWYKNGQLFDPNSHIRAKLYDWGLLLSSSTASDSGIYQCAASNPAGTIWSGASIRLNASNNNPSEPRDIQCLPFKADSVCLRWRGEPNVQAYTIIAHKIDAEVTEDKTKDYLTNETHILLEDLHPGANYTFLIRTFSKKASTEFANVTCSSGVRGRRNFTGQLDGTTMKLHWSAVSSDVDPCAHRRIKFYNYKVQWRRAYTDGWNTMDVTGFEASILGLVPGESYDFRVRSADSSTSVDSISLGIPPMNTTLDNVVNSTFGDLEVLAPPLQLEAISLSTSSVNVTWKDTNPSETTYNLCYLIADDKKSCEHHGKFVRGLPARSIMVERLRPKTMYEFRVQAQNDESLTPFSHSLYVTTPSDVPSEVQRLEFRVMSATSACVKWEPPSHSNGRINKYSIRYTSNSSIPLDKWTSTSVLMPRDSDGCWNSYDADAIILSTVLHDLDPESAYHVNVIAVNDAGNGNPAESLVVTTKFRNLVHDDEEEVNPDNSLYYRQGLGVAIGFVIALCCIFLCVIGYFLQRYLKQRFSRRWVGPNGIFPGAAASARPKTTNHSPPCNNDAHELQQLVSTNGHSHIPSMPTTILDTKGGVEYPNGIYSNSKPGGYLNGHATNVRIRENPQYLKSNVRNVDEASSATPTGYQEDSNSNLQMVCPLKQPACFKRPGQCNEGDLEDITPSEATQTTILLDDSMVSTTTPMLEPNG